VRSMFIGLAPTPNQAAFITMMSYRDALTLTIATDPNRTTPQAGAHLAAELERLCREVAAG
jgi:hypothetical protein